MAAGELARRHAVRARVGRVQRRLNLAVWLEALVVPAWVAVTAFVMWRVFVQRSLLPAGVLLAGVALVVTWWRGQGKRISVDAAAVIADRQAGLGGLLLTRLEVPIGGWEYDVNTRLKTLTMPAIDVRRPVTMLVFAFVFLLVGFLVPQTEHPVRAVNAAAATRVETLAEKFEALAKEEPTDEAAIAELQRLQEELKDGTFDATDWEAADSVEKGLDEKAAEAAAELSRAEQAAKALSDAVAQAQGN